MAVMRILLVVGADGAPFARDLGELLEPGDELTVVAPTVRGHVAAGLAGEPRPRRPPGTRPPPRRTPSPTRSRRSATHPTWQRASDQAVAARLVRTELVLTGTALTDATLAAGIRAALPYRLLPMCEDRAEFRVVVGSDEPRAIPVDEYLADPAAHEPTQLLLVADQISVSAAGLVGPARLRRAGAGSVEPHAGDRPGPAYARLPRPDQRRPAGAGRRPRGLRAGRARTCRRPARSTIRAGPSPCRPTPAPCSTGRARCAA